MAQLTPAADTDAQLAGLNVAALESRRAGDMQRLIERYGGKPHVSPSMREVPIEPNRQAIDFAYRVITGQINVVIVHNRCRVSLPHEGDRASRRPTKVSRCLVRYRDGVSRAETGCGHEGAWSQPNAPCSRAQTRGANFYKRSMPTLRSPTK